MNPPTISVVIPTHNRPMPLMRAVNSVDAQTLEATEIIVVDDGSQPPVDPSTFADVATRIVVVRHDTPMGASAARNAGAQRASGDYIAFLDDDDTWLPGKIEFVRTCLGHSNSVDIVIHRTGYRTPSTPLSHECSDIADPLSRMLHAQSPHIDGVVVSRAAHLATLFDEQLVAAEDLDYLIRLAKSGATMVESDAVLAVFGRDVPSVITIESRIDSRKALLDHHPEILADAQARSFFYTRLGQLQRRGGSRSPAIGSFTRAILARPTSAQPWKGLARSVAGR